MPIESIEYRCVSAAEPLRQGDIIEARAGDVGEWERVLVVITADCDLAHSKHEGNVTCVPILTADEYLLNVIFPRLREKLAEFPKGLIKDVLQRNLGKTISDERLLDWVKSAEIEAIRDSVQLDGESFAAVERCHRSIRLLCREYSSVHESMTAFVDAQVTANEALRREKAVGRVRDAIREAFRNPPGDAMFLSAIADGLGDGYFVSLRHITQVVETDVALRFKYGNHRYQRISRLTDRFIHFLVQRFAMVFLPIGMPKEFEETRDLIALMKVEGLS